jgi:hypothetical protein
MTRILWIVLIAAVLVLLAAAGWIARLGKPTDTFAGVRAG